MVHYLKKNQMRKWRWIIFIATFDLKDIVSRLDCWIQQAVHQKLHALNNTKRLYVFKDTCRYDSDCQNGGSCSSAVCICSPGHWGLFCEHSKYTRKIVYQQYSFKMVAMFLIKSIFNMHNVQYFDNYYIFCRYTNRQHITTQQSSVKKYSEM